MSGVLDLFGDDPETEDLLPEQPFLVYAHTLNLHAEGRRDHWTKVGETRAETEAVVLAQQGRTHTVVYHLGQTVFSNGLPPIPE